LRLQHRWRTGAQTEVRQQCEQPQQLQHGIRVGRARALLPAAPPRLSSRRFPWTHSPSSTAHTSHSALPVSLRRRRRDLLPRMSRSGPSDTIPVISRDKQDLTLLDPRPARPGRRTRSTSLAPHWCVSLAWRKMLLSCRTPANSRNDRSCVNFLNSLKYLGLAVRTTSAYCAARLLSPLP
jgi:hypothetical protein